MQVSDVKAPKVDKPSDLIFELGEAFGHELNDSELSDLLDVVVEIDVAAWNADGISRAGILLALCAGAKAGRASLNDTSHVRLAA